jgi:hypothetical protein
MEFLLLWWDELDDLAHACRHLVASAAADLATLSAPLASIAGAVGAFVFVRLLG